MNDANVLVLVTSSFPICVLFFKKTVTVGFPGTELPLKSYTPGEKL